MKSFFTSCLLLAVLSLFAQELTDNATKGLNPIPVKNNASGQTYAVVVGISDYQDEGIPDLRFADKDAEAFAGFLQSPAGGSLDEDHLKVLLNSDATTAQFDAALSWLIDESKEGDQTIIYFSGHGDVELKTRRQQGFLLCWDSPSKAYVAGAYPIFFIQEVIATLSLENKAKVLVITDACRSGKLAGSGIGGSQLTSQNLAQQYANETKILSCQPNEFSIEGEQWGGGRGAFSYHLIDGLIGMADNNNDQTVNLMEIGRYLEDNVTIEVAPQSQVPMTVGNRTKKITDVFPEMLAQVQVGKKRKMAIFASTESRGIEDNVLANVDSITREKYMLFKKHLDEKAFLEPADACANVYYKQLTNEPKLKRLHASMRRNFAAALQDDAQQVLNKILNNNVAELSLSKIDQKEKYRLYPGYLRRAAELLGEDHYMHPILQARMFYFEGYLLHHLNETADRELGELALGKYKMSINLQPDFPHPYYSMSEVYFWQMLEPDTAAYYADKAVELAPSWFVPYSALAIMMSTSENSKYYDKIETLLKQADQVDSTASRTNVWHMNQWGEYFLKTYQMVKAEEQFKKVIALDDSFAKAYYGLGVVYDKGGKFKAAEGPFLKAIALDPNNAQFVGNLGILYLNSARYPEAELQLKRAIQMDETNLPFVNGLASAYNVTGRFAKADSLFEITFLLDSTRILNYRYAAVSYAKANRFDKAEEYLLKGLKLDSNNVVTNYLLGSIYGIKGRYEEAELILLKVDKMAGPEICMPCLKGNLIWLYYKTDRIKQAEEESIKLVLTDSTNLEYRINQANLYIHIGKYSKAEKELNYVANIDPDIHRLNSTLGFLYMRTGRYKEAEKHLNIEQELHPYNFLIKATALFNFAIIYSMQNQVDTAFEYLEKAVENNYNEHAHISFKDEPAFDILRAETQRWTELMEKFSSMQNID